MFISFGRIDVARELRDINHKLGVLMALVSVDQTVLDAIGTELGAVADAVQALVDDDSNDLGPADLTSITGAVDRIQSALASPETPVEPETPVDEPTA